MELLRLQEAPPDAASQLRSAHVVEHVLGLEEAAQLADGSVEVVRPDEGATTRFMATDAVVCPELSEQKNRPIWSHSSLTQSSRSRRSRAESMGQSGGPSGYV